MKKKLNVLVSFLCPIIFLCFFLFTTSSSAMASAEFRHFVLTFKNLSIQDANSAVEVWGTVDTRQKWHEHASGVLGDPLRSRTYFSPAIFFIEQVNDHFFVVAYYNPWIDALLTMKVDGNDRAPQITGFDLIMPKEASALSGLDADSISAELSRRVRNAQNEFAASKKKWIESNTAADRSEEWQMLKDQLNSKIYKIRDALSWEGSPEKKALRIAFEQVVSSLRSETVEEVVGLSLSRTESSQWRNTLYPVLVDESDDFPVIVLFSREVPLLYLWLKLRPDQEKTVIAERILDISSSVESP